MRTLIASFIALAGVASHSHAQLAIMRMLVSTDGVNFQSSVNAAPGSHIDVLVTASYTGTQASVAGFASANFQPTVSQWNDGVHPDSLNTILQGGNVLGSMINAQTAGAGLGAPNPYLTPTPGTNGGAPVPAGPYSPTTYGRVYPMGRTYHNGYDAITGFVHHNPDGSGQTYLRIANANVPDWFNATTNPGNGGGIDCAQLYVVGRSTSDPDFWGNRDLTYDPGNPDEETGPGFVPSDRISAHDSRLQNVQLFRFGIDLSTDSALRTMIVDAPIAGQQTDPATGNHYISFFVNPFQATGSLRVSLNSGQAVVEQGTIHVVPTPGVLAIGGAFGLLVARRRRA